MLGAGGIGGDKGEIDLGLHGGGQLYLGLLRRFFESLEGHTIFSQIDPLFLLELIGNMFDEPLIEILSAQMGVPVGGFDLEDPLSQLQDRDIKGPAAQVEDGDLGLLLFFKPIGEGGGCRLIDDPQDFESGDLPRIFGGLALAVVEIGRDGNDRLGHLFSQVVLSRLLHLLQDHGRDLLGAVVLTLGLNPGITVARFNNFIRSNLDVLLYLSVRKPSADEPFYGIDGVFGIGDGLAAGDLSDQPFPLVGKGHH